MLGKKCKKLAHRDKAEEQKWVDLNVPGIPALLLIGAGDDVIEY